MSTDGTRVLFTDGAPLLPSSSKNGADLYECAMIEEAGSLKCGLADLTPESSQGSSEVANMVLGASADGSYVYFVANGPLASNETLGSSATRGSCKPNGSPSTTCNLYVYHDGATRFIATLSSEDETDWGLNSNFLHRLGNLTARVSSNGRFAAFMSSRSLTGYDNHDLVSGKPDQEVYVYDAVREDLVCVSCDPTGARPIGANREDASVLAGLARINAVGYSSDSWIAGNLVPGDQISEFGQSLYQSRELFDSGRLFFNSSDALAPGDINGGEDVYEWEPPGEGCAEGFPGFNRASGGCVSLVSSGSAVSGAGFLDAGGHGNDAFFITGGRLTTKDVDGALDVYDAHVCGSGWDCAGEPAAPPPCASAEACHAPAGAQSSVFGPPPSATFKGAGNAVAPSRAPARKSKALTRAEKLSRALASCHRKKARRPRSACERAARKRYGKAAARRVTGRRGKGGRR
jgi:hypothetical protein